MFLSLAKIIQTGRDIHSQHTNMIFQLTTKALSGLIVFADDISVKIFQNNFGKFCTLSKSVLHIFKWL
jgi:hypothetical protein